MKITFNRKEIANVFREAAEDIRCNYGNDYGKKLLTTREQNASKLLEDISEALYLAEETTSE